MQQYALSNKQYGQKCLPQRQEKWIRHADCWSRRFSPGILGSKEKESILARLDTFDKSDSSHRSISSVGDEQTVDMLQSHTLMDWIDCIAMHCTDTTFRKVVVIFFSQSYICNWAEYSRCGRFLISNRHSNAEVLWMVSRSMRKGYYGAWIVCLLYC